MSLFGFAKTYDMLKLYNKLVMRLDAADSDRRRLKGNLDKLGGQVTDLECKIKNLEGGKCNGKKHKQ